MKNQKKWKKEKKLKILNELNNNLTITQISLNYKRSQNAIRSRIKLLAYNIYKDGISVDEICSKTKLDTNSLDVLIERKNKIKTPNNREIYQKFIIFLLLP